MRVKKVSWVLEVISSSRKRGDGFMLWLLNLPFGEFSLFVPLFNLLLCSSTSASIGCHIQYLDHSSPHAELFFTTSTIS